MPEAQLCVSMVSMVSISYISRYLSKNPDFFKNGYDISIGWKWTSENIAAYRERISQNLNA